MLKQSGYLHPAWRTIPSNCLPIITRCGAFRPARTGAWRARSALFDQGALHITGVDDNGEARVFELEGHPFFMATLFQPERMALKGVMPPLARAFLQAAR